MMCRLLVSSDATCVLNGIKNTIPQLFPLSNCYSISVDHHNVRSSLETIADTGDVSRDREENHVSVIDHGSLHVSPRIAFQQIERK